MSDIIDIRFAAKYLVADVASADVLPTAGRLSLLRAALSSTAPERQWALAQALDEVAAPMRDWDGVDADVFRAAYRRLNVLADEAAAAQVAGLKFTLARS